MNQPIYHFFEQDHRRLDQLLDQACANGSTIDLDLYNEFRIGLLRHIKMEEKILFPVAKQEDPEQMAALIPRYRLEHGAITALMVPPPTFDLVKVIRYVVEKHDLAEEEPGGLYEICENLTAQHSEKILQQLYSAETVPVHPPNPTPIAIESARRALARAGYDFDAILAS